MHFTYLLWYLTNMIGIAFVFPTLVFISRNWQVWEPLIKCMPTFKFYPFLMFLQLVIIARCQIRSFNNFVSKMWLVVLHIDLNTVLKDFLFQPGHDDDELGWKWECTFKKRLSNLPCWRQYKGKYLIFFTLYNFISMLVWLLYLYVAFGPITNGFKAQAKYVILP